MALERTTVILHGYETQLLEVPTLQERNNEGGEVSKVLHGDAHKMEDATGMEEGMRWRWTITPIPLTAHYSNFSKKKKQGKNV